MYFLSSTFHQTKLFSRVFQVSAIEECFSALSIQIEQVGMKIEGIKKNHSPHVSMQSWFQSSARTVLLKSGLVQRLFGGAFLVRFFTFKWGGDRVCVIFIRYCRFITWLNQYSGVRRWNCPCGITHAYAYWPGDWTTMISVIRHQGQIPLTQWNFANLILRIQS